MPTCTQWQPHVRWPNSNWGALTCSCTRVLLGHLSPLVCTHDFLLLGMSTGKLATSVHTSLNFGVCALPLGPAKLIHSYIAPSLAPSENQSKPLGLEHNFVGKIISRHTKYSNNLFFKIYDTIFKDSLDNSFFCTSIKDIYKSFWLFSSHSSSV